MCSVSEQCVAIDLSVASRRQRPQLDTPCMPRARLPEEAGAADSGPISADAPTDQSTRRVDPTGSEYADHAAGIRAKGWGAGADGAEHGGGEARRRAMGMPTGAKYQPGAEGQQQGSLGGMDEPTPGAAGVEIGEAKDAPKGTVSP